MNHFSRSDHGYHKVTQGFWKGCEKIPTLNSFGKDKDYVSFSPLWDETDYIITKKNVTSISTGDAWKT